MADRVVRLGGNVLLPIRMMILENEPGSLACYSPVEFDSATLEAVAGLGSVQQVIVANRFHMSFVTKAVDLFPAATLYVPPTSPGLTGIVPNATVSRLGCNTEMFVLRMRTGFEELVLYHDKSETLVVSDLFFNLTGATGLQKFLLRLNGIADRPGQSRLHKLLLMREKEQIRKFYRWALAKPFTQICMAHGQVVDKEAREVFYQLFHRYL